MARQQYLSGGEQTTINSTITELFPALAFNNNKSIKSSEEMLQYILSLSQEKQLAKPLSKKSFVDNGDMISAYKFIEDTAKIKPKMLNEKLDNAVGILKYLKETDRTRPINKVIWGYRAKPNGIDKNHPGDIFIIFKKGSPKIAGISLKAGTAKSAEPKMNSYVRTTIKKPMWQKADRYSQNRLKKELWRKCYSKLPGLFKGVNQNNWINIDSRNQKPQDVVVAAVLKQFQSSPVVFDELYQIQNRVCRQHMCDMINNNFEATKQWIGEEFRLETQGSSTEVPLTLVKAIGNRATEQGDKLAKIYPRITRVNAYLNSSSVQEWFIDVFAGREKLTLLMTIRSDSSYRESKQKGKLGAFMNLKLLYRGYK